MYQPAFIESIAGLKRIRAEQPPGHFFWYTASVAAWELLIQAGERVQPIEQWMDQDELNATGRLTHTLARDLEECLNKTALSQYLGLALGSAAFPQLKRTLDPLLVRAILAERFMQHEPSPNIWIAGRTAFSKTSPGFMRFTDHDDLYFALLTRSIYAERFRPLAIAAEANTARGKRRSRSGQRLWNWVQASPSGMAYRLWRRVTGGRAMQWGSPVTTDIFIYNCSESIKDAFWLFLKYKACMHELDLGPLLYPASASTNRLIAMGFDASAQHELGQQLQRVFLRLVQAAGYRGPCFEAAAGLLAERLLSFLQAFLPFAEQSKALFQTLSIPRPRVLLTNGLTDPIERTVYQRAHQQGIHTIVIQHGGSVGLTAHHSENASIFDIAASEGYLHRHSNGRRHYQQVLGSAFPKSRLLGSPRCIHQERFPALMRHMARKALKVRCRQRVIIYVTNVLQGPWLAIPHGHLDSHYYAYLRRIVTDIFTRVDAHCIVKLYPQRSGEEPHPIHCIPCPANVEVVQNIDFRHIRRAADLIVADVPYSTLGWAMGADIPTVLLDLPTNPLLPEVVPWVEQALFRVDAHQPHWPQALLQLLNHPPAQIAQLWQEKKKQRAAFLRYAVFGPAVRQAPRIAAFALHFHHRLIDDKGKSHAETHSGYSRTPR
jgi:hypothetical protein